MALYIARGPISLPGIEQRSGDTFEADPEAIAPALAEGLAELLEPVRAKGRRTAGPVTDDTE